MNSSQNQNQTDFRIHTAPGLLSKVQEMWEDMNYIDEEKALFTVQELNSYTSCTPWTGSEMEAEVPKKTLIAITADVVWRRPKNCDNVLNKTKHKHWNELFWV